MEKPDRRPGREYSQQHDEPHAEQNVADILLLERVEEELVPAIDRQGGGEIGEQEEQNRRREQPGTRAGLTAPESA